MSRVLSRASDCCPLLITSTACLIAKIKDDDIFVVIAVHIAECGFGGMSNRKFQRRIAAAIKDADIARVLNEEFILAIARQVDDLHAFGGVYRVVTRPHHCQIFQQSPRR